MSIEHPPHEKHASPDDPRGFEYSDNVLPFHKCKAQPQARGSQHQNDEFFAALSPLLEEADGLRDEPLHQETNDFLLLLEENARLRKLAVRLSNLLGDLPERDVCELSRRRRAIDDDR